MPPDVVCGAERVSRPVFDDRALRGASVLRAHGIGPDDVVACIMRNSVAYLEVTCATVRAGAVFCPVNWHVTAAELAPILADSGARLAVVDADLLPALAPALAGLAVLAVTPEGGPWRRACDAASPFPGQEPMRPFLRYTSGSTGRPKGIRRIGKAGSDYWEVSDRIGRQMMRMRDGGRFYTAAPLYHSAPGTLSLMALATGTMDVVVAPRFDAEGMLADLARHRITHCYLVPTMMVRLLKLPEAVRAAFDPSALEFCISTGSPWPQEVKRAMIDWWGPVMWETYGATELGFLTLASSADALARPGTAGRIQLGGSILIAGPDGRPLPPGEIGTVHVRMSAFGDFDYTNEPGTRAAAEVEGHVGVGDMGWLDAEGYLFLADRAKDMIISGGVNIFPAEIEAALIEAPFVRDCAVFGAPDPEFGECVVAAVEPAEGHAPTPEAVRDWLAARIARFKLPRHVEFHAALPREETGKVFKPKLRAPWWQGTGRRI